MVGEAGSEATRLGKTIEASSSYEKDQEYEVAIVREEMHLQYEPVKGDITYRC